MKLYAQISIIVLYASTLSAALRPEPSEKEVFIQKLNTIFMPENNPWIRISKNFDKQSQEDWESLCSSINFFINIAFSSDTVSKRTSSLPQRVSAAFGKKTSSGDVSDPDEERQLLNKQLTVLEISGQNLIDAIKNCKLGPSPKRSSGELKNYTPTERFKFVVFAKSKLPTIKEDLTLAKNNLELELKKIRGSRVILKEKGNALEVIIPVFGRLIALTEQYYTVLENFISYINKIELKAGTLFGTLLSGKYPIRLDAKKELFALLNNFNGQIIRRIPNFAYYKFEDIINISGKIIDNLNNIIIGSGESAAKNIRLPDYFENNALAKIQMMPESASGDARVVIIRDYGDLLKIIDYFEKNEDAPHDLIADVLLKYLQELKAACDKVKPDLKENQYRSSINNRGSHEKK